MNSNLGSYELSAKMITDFLKKNPDFFIDHPELIELINVKQHDRSNVISLSDRKFKNLQQENASIKKILAEFIETAEQNDKLATNIHKTTINLVKSDNLASLVKDFCEALRTEFEIKHFALRLTGIEDKELNDLIDPESELLTLAEKLNGPTYTKAPFQISVGWFKNISEIKSFVYCPIKTCKTLGILALGSPHENYYSDEKDSVYLQRLMQLLSANIQRLM
ncbi:MAG: hypothetical protein CMK56_06160 [Proteobacteria bacterium]|nr:hypothetical protein [Pseudomonadota bacterium]